MCSRESLHPTGCRVQPELQFVKRQSSVDFNHELTVKDEFFRRQAQERVCDVGKITRERLTRFRLQKDFCTLAEGETTEAVPLRLILPVIAAWYGIHGFRLHRRKRRL